MEIKKITESTGNKYKKGDNVLLANGQTGTVCKDYELDDDRLAVCIDDVNEIKYPLVDSVRLLTECTNSTITESANESTRKLPTNESYDEEGNHERCENCDTLLTDSGECPVCDLGEEDMSEKLIESFEIMNNGYALSDGTNGSLYYSKKDDLFLLLDSNKEPIGVLKGDEFRSEKDIEDNQLNEAPVIKLSADDVNNSDGFDLSKTVQRAEKEEQEAEEARIRAEEEKELENKYGSAKVELRHAIEEHMDPEDILQLLFDKLVPSEGAAEVIAGEIVRAMMRILYRFYNDGDMFFEDYGLETAGPSAEYLYDNGFAKNIASMFDKFEAMSSDEDLYEKEIKSLTKAVVEYLDENPQLFTTPSTVDSRDYEVEIIADHAPEYEFEFYASDDLDLLISEGVVNSWDLVNYVTEQLRYSYYTQDATVERPWSNHDTTVTISGLNKEAYRYVKEDLFSNVDAFWAELVDEYSDELDRIENDYDSDNYDDDVDEE